MYGLDFLIGELSLLGVLGRKDSDKVRVYTMFRSRDTLLLRALGHSYWRDMWISVRRSSRQCYQLTVMTETFIKSAFDISFSSYRLTADYIKNLIK